MRLAAAMVLLIPLLAACSESRPESRRVAESRRELSSLTNVADVAGEVEDLADLAARAAAVAAADPKGEKMPGLLRMLGFGWQRVGRDDKAIECFEESGKHPGERGISAMLIVSVLGKHEDYDKAVAVVESAIDAEADDSSRNMLYGALTSLEGKRGDWRKALDAAEKLKLVEGGIEYYTPAWRRVRIARCRFHLGEVDAALKALEQCMVEVPLDGFSMNVRDVAATYAEFSAKSGRLDAARMFAATLAGDREEILRDAIEKAKAQAAESKPASRPDSRPK